MTSELHNIYNVCCIITREKAKQLEKFVFLDMLNHNHVGCGYENQLLHVIWSYKANPYHKPCHQFEFENKKYYYIIQNDDLQIINTKVKFIRNKSKN